MARHKITYAAALRHTEAVIHIKKDIRLSSSGVKDHPFCTFNWSYTSIYRRDDLITAELEASFFGLAWSFPISPAPEICVDYWNRYLS